LKLKPKRDALSGKLRELNISTAQLLIQGNLNNNKESILARKHISNTYSNREARKLQKSEKTQPKQEQYGIKQINKNNKKITEIKKKLISSRSSRSGSEYHLMRLLRRGVHRKTSPNRCSTNRISQRARETQQNGSCMVF